MLQLLVFQQSVPHDPGGASDPVHRQTVNVPVVPETLWVRIVILVVIALRDSGGSCSICCVVAALIFDTACSGLVLHVTLHVALCSLLRCRASVVSHCRWQFCGFLRRLCHEEPVPGDDRDAELRRVLIAEKFIVIPEVLTVLFTQTFGSLGDARDVQFLARSLTCPLVCNFLVLQQKTGEDPQLQFIVEVMS